MRVIAGQAKGHKLKAPEGIKTRPTTDKIKESLFNILAPDLPDAVFLDLFSGSGGIGIEALSRGAKKAVFVDNSPVCSKIIAENLRFTKLVQKAQVYKLPVLAALDKLAANGEKFDIIFMDPPYEGGYYGPALEKIAAWSLLAEGGLIICEHSRLIELPMAAGLRITREKEYKTTVMTFITAGE